jgi:hypothetical protein
MGIVREVEAGLRIGGTADGIDPERTDFPVGRDRPDQEENQDQPGKKQEKSKPPPAPAVLRILGTPRWKAHLGPTLAPPGYDPCFTRGRSTMPL